MISGEKWKALEAMIDGDIFTDNARLIMYSTDASAYSERPLAVVYPRNENDIRELVRFASSEGETLIPRTAGTSLAGQVVGAGIVVDLSRYMTGILEINRAERWVRVQPGVVLDELNLALKPYGLFFSPETSTSNRSMIGGMIGNNSCGLHSLVYGTTRDHTISVRAVLADGTVAEFGPLDHQELEQKRSEDSYEGTIFREIHEILVNPDNRKEIQDNFPDPGVIRRNTGYALDELLNCTAYSGSGAKYSDFNLCRLLAGSEGTLALIIEATLHLDPLPPLKRALVPVHFKSVMEAVRGNLLVLKHKPTAVELMDKTILDCTKENITQRRNRFFLEGDPGAILIVEFCSETGDELKAVIDRMIGEMKAAGSGYHYPVVTGDDVSKVWTLRKAGLGVLSNLPGEGSPVSVIEDTSVRVDLLEDYLREFNQLLGRYGLDCVYHAHISVGELHMRPVLNLKDPLHVKLFHEIALESARLVKKYRGSLSGEHGDGRLRGEFIPLMVGEHNYQLIKTLKKIWDPDNLFNAGKIIDTPPMNSHLRYSPDKQIPDIRTYFDYSREGGFVRLVEKCNGSGDCRKTELTGGTMCPSYMATRDEAATTRARANILRELLSGSGKSNPFDHREIFDVLDLCLSCKACKSECPSNVDMAKLKAEFLQHWYHSHSIPLRTRLIAGIYRIDRMGSLFPVVFNRFILRGFISKAMKRLLGLTPLRNLPVLDEVTLRKWTKRHLEALNSTLSDDAPEVILYVDEFTNHHDTGVGITAIRLLNRLGIRILIHDHLVSARTYISKGMLKMAGRIVRKNIEQLSDLVTDERPLVGLEPSAILGFRDEFPDLAGSELRSEALRLGRLSMMIEEYLSVLLEKGELGPELFTRAAREVLMHGHCHQKAIASTSETLKILSVPENYSVREIPSGCCGMAGSFGYEKEHFELSMQVGELVLFPAIRKAGKETIIVAPGTSCRQQIEDGTMVRAKHPVEVLYEALK